MIGFIHPPFQCLLLFQQQLDLSTPKMACVSHCYTAPTCLSQLLRALLKNLKNPVFYSILVSKVYLFSETGMSH